MNWEESPREMRLSGAVRGLLIGVLLTGYTVVSKQPGASLTATFLIGAGLQLAVIVVRRWLPAERQPLVVYIFELIADGATVLLFALGVFGGIMKVSETV
jgi:hypothetical protein